MLFERIGKLLFSQIKPPFFLLLLFTPLLCILLWLIFQLSSLQTFENQFLLLKKKAELAYPKKKSQENFFLRYQNADPFYLDHAIEAHPFLQSELQSLQSLVEHPAIANKVPLLERIQFLSSNNLISFIEEETHSSPSIKETIEKQRFPIQMNNTDLKYLLSLLEDLPIETFPPATAKPQFLITDFHLHKKLSPLQTEIFEVEIELLKREFH